MDKLKILVAPSNSGGCSQVRLYEPYKVLQDTFPEEVEIRFNENPLGRDPNTGQLPPDDIYPFEDMHWADIIITNNLSNFGGNYTARVVGKAKEFGKFVIYDTDDLLVNLYDGHLLQDVYRERNLAEITKHIYAHSDLVTVTQTKFAERIAPYCGSKLAVIKNTINYDHESWNVPKIPARKNLTRIGWAGGVHHLVDVKEFNGVPSMVNQRAGTPNVEWRLCGRPPLDAEGKHGWQQRTWDTYVNAFCRGMKGPRNVTVLGALPIESYGAFYSTFDIGIAPLQMNDFNDSKSDIKVAECARYAVPLVASNVGCYSDTIENGKTGYLIDPDAPRSEWVRILTKLCKDKKHREELGKNLKFVGDNTFDMKKTIHLRWNLIKETYREWKNK